MERLVVPEPTVEECGGRLYRTNIGSRVVVDEVRKFQGPVSTYEIRRLTADRRAMNRIARRSLARKRKFKVEQRRLLRERRIQLIHQRFADSSGAVGREQLRRMLNVLMPKAPPSDEEGKR